MNKQTNKTFFILNISAKSSPHKNFRETSCGCPTIIKNKKKQLDNQSNKFAKKERMKQIYIFYPKYLSQIKSDFHENFRATSCGCPTMIKTKNKQIKKQQTKKQMNLFYPKYLSQIKMDLHKIFRVTSCVCPKIIKT